MHIQLFFRNAADSKTHRKKKSNTNFNNLCCTKASTMSQYIIGMYAACDEEAAKLASDVI